MPPVRTDRDSILIGTLSHVAPVKLEMKDTLNGKPLTLKWSSTPEKPSEDFGFLPKLVDLAAADKGLSLPTAGSAALREAAYVTLNSAQQLAKLGNEALASGNFTGAEKVAEAALARDPRSEEHTSELQSPCNLVCRLLLEKKKKHTNRVSLTKSKKTANTK